ncbi:hypothetical protein [Serratia sp. AKBS12]|uniref:hypothetical protein n=1 Tax=Serratia sp. AKBS12 TaxID=2974597 RepID=UPI0021669BC7|nr:hypothetical protein [Serratia sp. AKBS12]MCS3407109.1 hypothetical protein [Serratia sp. AKBS12]HEI8868872.1 hypothetical protein [Serratia odorifera]
MSVRALFILLICMLAWGGINYIAVTIWQEKHIMPNTPCYSVIKDGRFIDDLHNNYTLNSVVTWWPRDDKLSFFGVKSDRSGGKIIKRTLNLGEVKKYDGILRARVDSVDISPSDQLGKTNAMFASAGQPMTIIFKPLTRKSWLMMINDNWVLMCEKR